MATWAQINIAATAWHVIAVGEIPRTIVNLPNAEHVKATLGLFIIVWDITICACTMLVLAANNFEVKLCENPS